MQAKAKELVLTNQTTKIMLHPLTWASMTLIMPESWAVKSARTSRAAITSTKALRTALQRVATRAPAKSEGITQ